MTAPQTHEDSIRGLEDLDEFYDGLPCQRCDEGFVVVCPDDLCLANGGCGDFRPGNGCYGVCPHCKGNWE